MKIYLTKNDKEFPISMNIRNFVPSEFNTGGAETFCMDTRILNIIQTLRDILGVQIVVNSGFRTEEYNKKVGGAKDSLHLKGMAIDFTLNSEGIAKYNILNVVSILHLLMKKNRVYDAGGIEVDIHPEKKNGWGYIHIDCRDDLWRAVRFAGGSYYTCNDLLDELSMNKASVYAWQYMMNCLCRAGLKVDGIYGEKTRVAYVDLIKKVGYGLPTLLCFGLMNGEL